MAYLTIVSVDQGIPQSLIEEFKQYASMPDGSRDAVLVGLLKSAILRVQEYADAALVACTARQVAQLPDGSGTLRLYLGGGEVVSVRRMDGGDSMDFDSLPGGRLSVHGSGCEVEVVFRARPDVGNLERCRATVLRYATALYDGEGTEVLNSILNEAL